MGRPKVVTIDDSQSVEEKKPVKKVRKAVQATEVEPATQEAEQTSSVILEGAERPIESEKDAIAQRQAPLIASLQHDKTKKAQKPGKAKPRSKKYQELVKDLDRSKSYPLGEAVDMVKKLSYTKFNATLEGHINTVQTGLRGFLSLPYANGRKLRILTFGKGSEQSGADLIGSDETIDEISKGKINFDLVITTPDWMPKLAKAAKVLGPRGLMPNPKSGTITDDLKKAVASFQAGKTEYKTEAKAPIIHLVLGKLDQPTEELSANLKMLLQTVGKTKIKKVVLSPTMGPSVKVDLASV